MKKLILAILALGFTASLHAQTAETKNHPGGFGPFTVGHRNVKSTNYNVPPGTKAVQVTFTINAPTFEPRNRSNAGMVFRFSDGIEKSRMNLRATGMGVDKKTKEPKTLTRRFAVPPGAKYLSGTVTFYTGTDNYAGFPQNDEYTITDLTAVPVP